MDGSGMGWDQMAIDMGGWRMDGWIWMDRTREEENAWLGEVRMGRRDRRTRTDKMAECEGNMTKTKI